MTDIAPVCLMYAGLNSTLVTSPAVSTSGYASYTTGKITNGVTCNTAGGSTDFNYTNLVMEPRRGSMAFWVKFTSNGYNEFLRLFPGPPDLNIRAQSGAPGSLSITQTFDGLGTFAGATQDAISGEVPNFTSTDGFHHFVWTWQGTHQCLYVDGVLAAERVMLSPFPLSMQMPLYVGHPSASSGTLVFDEFAVYNYVLNSTDIAASYAASSSAAITASGTYGMNAVAQWAPGIGQALVMVDPGNEYATRAHHADVVIKLDGSSVATATLANPVGGFLQGVIPVTTPFAVGTYTAEVTLKNSSNTTLATQTTSSFTVPETKWRGDTTRSAATDWLGNTLGLTDAVPSPWTAISVSGLVLSVWGRTYDLTGGWGLPQQITSQGKSLLASPVDIDFDIGAGAFNLTPSSLSIASSADHCVTWTGVATGGGITATIAGSLEYDGMMQIQLTLEPTSTPVDIDLIQMKMSMPPERALFFAWLGAKSVGAPASYDPVVPPTAGEFWNNIGDNAYTNLIPSITVSDDDRGLEWFAENLSGWSVSLRLNTSTSIQRLIVDADTTVRLECDFANVSFTLDAARVINFGFAACPVKALTPGWRVMQIGDSGGSGPAVAGQYDLNWLFPDDSKRSGLWRYAAWSPGETNDVPTDTATVLSNLTTGRGNGLKYAPYVQLHTIIAPSTTSPNTTDEILPFLIQEAASYGQPTEFQGFQGINYISALNRGLTDYIVSCWDYNLTQGVADAIYMDEPFYAFAQGAAQVANMGFTDETLVRKRGYNSLGFRQAIKRLRQLHLDHGFTNSTPKTWINGSTGGYSPHLYAFVDAASDGEIGGDYIFDDWLSHYNTPERLAWLRGTSRGHKWGFIQVFLNYVGWTGNETTFNRAARQIYGTCQLFDLNVQGTYHQGYIDFMQARVNFGMGEDDVEFTGYWANNEIVPAGILKCSYYKRPGSVFANFVTLTSTGVTAESVSIDPAALGLVAGTITAQNAETGDPITLVGDSFDLDLDGYNYVAVQFDGDIAASNSLSALAGSYALTGNAVTLSHTTANRPKVHFRLRRV